MNKREDKRTSLDTTTVSDLSCDQIYVELSLHQPHWFYLSYTPALESIQRDAEFRIWV